MSQFDRRQRRQDISWLICLSLLCTVSSVQAGEVEGESGEIAGSIGTAVYVKRNTQDALKIYANPRSSFLTLEDKFRDETFLPKVPSRTLKFAGGCSEGKNDMASIVECSNTVRLNPDQFARDYPCNYEDFRAEISGESRGTLSTGPVIQRVAQLHTDDQARMNSMSHTGSDGSNLQTRADRVSLPWGAVGENVAVGFSSAKAVVMAWMCSPPHRKNLMSCGFSQIGVGTSVSQNGRKFYTQVFMCDISESCSCDSGAQKKQTYTPASAHGHVQHQSPPAIPAPAAHSPPHASGSSASATAHGSHATATATATAHGHAPAHPSAASHCAWVNGIWTCGANVPPQHDVHQDEYRTKYGYSS